MSCSVAQVVVLLLAVVAAVHGSSASSALGSELAPMPASFEGAPLSPGRTRAVIDRQDAAIEQLEDMCERQAADLDQARQRERDASRTLAKLKGDLSRSLQACEVDHQPLLEAHQACPEEKAKQQAQISDLVRQRRHLESQVQRLQAALEGSNALRRKALEDKAALFSKLEACRQMAQQDADWRSMLMERDEELAAATAEIASLTRSLAEREADLALAVEQLRELQLVCRDDHEIHQRGGNGVAITATRPWTTSPTVPTLEQELQRAGYDNSLPEHIVEDQNASKDGTSETVGEPPAPGAEGPCSCRRSPTPSPEQECQTARPGIAPGPTIKAQSAPHAAATESNVAGARNDQAHRLSRLQVWSCTVWRERPPVALMRVVNRRASG
ncbi:Uncharacterized protein PBTT_02069 [Plasmodiophora brassicae]